MFFSFSDPNMKAENEPTFSKFDQMFPKRFDKPHQTTKNRLLLGLWYRRRHLCLGGCKSGWWFFHPIAVVVLKRSSHCPVFILHLCSGMINSVNAFQIGHHHPVILKKKCQQNVSHNSNKRTTCWPLEYERIPRDLSPRKTTYPKKTAPGVASNSGCGGSVGLLVPLATQGRSTTCTDCGGMPYGRLGRQVDISAYRFKTDKEPQMVNSL